MLKEMRKIDECDMKKFGTLDNSEKTMAIVADRWWSYCMKQEGDEKSKTFLYMENTS